MTSADDAYRAIRQAVLKDAPDALDGIRSARAYGHAAARLAAEQVTRARAEGAGWLDIGRALGLADAEPYEVATAAYEQSCGADSFGDPLPFWFPCGSCGRIVTDRGPFAASPMDREEGHADGCARHAGAVRAYRAQRDDDEPGGA